jgi:uncharacterized YigZ family protein
VTEPRVTDSADPDRYDAAGAGPEAEIKVKASRFIGQVFPATTREEAEAALSSVRKRHHDARHHCWAFRVGAPGALVETSSDDGEPGGTAGVPILGALQRAGLHDAACVVTRWFGGTKLGTGGLVRAYGEAAQLAVEATPVRSVLRRAFFAVSCGYDEVGTVEAILAKLADRVLSTERQFESAARFVVCSAASESQALRDAIAEAAAGRARIEDLGEDLAR